MVNHNNQARALRYRRLAIAEPDPKAAALLRKLADDAESGLLCSSSRALQPAEKAKPPEPPMSAR